MRSLPLLLCLTLALATVLLVSPGYAGEAPPARKPKVNTNAAGEIGRGLLSTQPAIRAKAVARLVAQIQKIDKEGGSLGAFLAAMTKATHAWADRHERLMEVWLDQAVNGNAAERRRAVRLLAALGEKAVQRLAEELRHSRRHGGNEQADEEDETPGASPHDEPDPFDAPGPEVAAGSPQVYELKDLFARGMNAVQLRSLCLKIADAVAVKQFRTQFVVTAAEKGHTLLQEKLHDVRVAGILADKSKAEQAATGEAKDDAKVPAAPAAPRGRPAPPQGDGRQPRDAAPVTDAPAAVGAPKRPRAEKVANARRWRLEPLLFHVPGPALADLKRRQAPSSWSRLLPAAFLRGAATFAVPGENEHARVWSGALRRVPDARAGLPLRGQVTLATGEHTTLFAGKQIHYSKTVRRTKGGAWGIVTDTIPHGIAVDLRIVEGLDGPTVRVTATRTEVGLPIPVVSVQPSPKAAAVELEQPEWSTTRTRTRVRLPKKGGGAFVSLAGLGASQDEHVVLIFALTPAPPLAQAASQPQGVK